jgi:FMN phosphatase YigB (HAD superfamily)
VFIRGDEESAANESRKADLGKCVAESSPRNFTGARKNSDLGCWSFAMISAILFDLDGTLLENSIDSFLPAYLKELGKFMASAIEPDRLSEALTAGTRAMLKNSDPEITLQQAFDSVFFPGIGMEKEPLMPVFDRFYTERFPALRSMTRPVEMAPRAVELSFARDWKVAVATNPLFPMTAIRQRLAWAGVDPQETPFDWITSYEQMHFAKPRPEFVGEVLAMLAAQPEEAAFVGNDVEEDIAPARALGAASFRVAPETQSNSVPIPGEGSMRELAASLEAESGDPSLFLPSPGSPESLPALLSGHLAAIGTIFRVTDWCCCPQEEGWGPVEIACHLRDVERETLQPRLGKILAGGNPYLPAVESDQWAEERHYRTQDGPQALRDFIAARRKTIELLRNLPPESWRFTGRHALFGPSTLAEQVRFIAHHDLLHIEQFRGALAASGDKHPK